MYKEKLIRELFKRKFPNEKVFYNYRPDWLKNPLTGYNLELDIYYPDLKLAVEVQGIHHQLDDQKFRDMVKVKVCNEKGITLEIVEMKQKCLDKLIAKYDFDTTDLKVKKFGQGTPRKGSVMWNYYKETTDRIKREAYSTKWHRIYQAQREERERLKRVRERNQ